MDKKHHIAIYTTASIPWLTGTSVNPLFRAAYLAKDGAQKVTLVVPWLPLKDQEHVFPNGIKFSSHLEQEKCVHQWVEERTGFASNFSIRFYPGKFSLEKRSILALGDITVIIPDDEADVAVLEEPEHLTWFHHGKRWKKKFRLVVGIVHTNYLEYVRRERNAVQAFFLKQINSWVVDIYCHKVIRLSAATQDLPRSLVCNVHGVNPKFLQIGMKTREKQQKDNQAFSKGVYYIGKMLWSKGYKELLRLLRDHQKELTGLEINLHGSGEDSAQIEAAFKKLELAVKVHPARDHADPLFHDYKVLLNPSTTDVVCTTTAEALAMGKIVVCTNHPSNEFFMQFPNCRTYDDSEGFVKATLKALSDEPAPLADKQRHELSWEAATERFLEVAQLDVTPVRKQSKTTSKSFLSTSLSLKKKLEDASAGVHFVGTGFLSSQPDEEQCKELGLSIPSKKKGFSSGRWI
ncbi:digalactosyldiacylglycerol synthase 2, chloroplastic-like [Nicotiana tabacum]|uniref:Digalactosyldiacylglycerol synthase 2, chloroplastic-like n=2 Tax=Nicotiana TaxID=4085 RepID=A0AC58UP47_TOBAC|nr:PREDICTED: digalactosyldiacylglycerol synthase 2, chloroplastic-like [Nicotiana sylvestris]XP_009762428.1 PREDICTED: digalactosyldiacylglycerol synthase 2, chloroplastic-like [Nicotiana sylvestris]XP_009762429.1 PREDICTED: digalactosyldiacylglycerol synthase 2, chloroplastic-like [Nicotiana sylvestris]